jgi:hypothetical protein
MALAKRNPDIPGVSTDPAKCRKLVDDEETKCGAPASEWVEGEIVVMEKRVRIKLPVCAVHATELRTRAAEEGSND